MCIRDRARAPLFPLSPADSPPSIYPFDQRKIYIIPRFFFFSLVNSLSSEQQAVLLGLRCSQIRGLLSDFYVYGLPQCGSCGFRISVSLSLSLSHYSFTGAAAFETRGELTNMLFACGLFLTTETEVWCGQSLYIRGGCSWEWVSLTLRKGLWYRRHLQCFSLIYIRYWGQEDVWLEDRWRLKQGLLSSNLDEGRCNLLCLQDHLHETTKGEDVNIKSLESQLSRR
eukprot:TRINITY_DN1703_c0_g1_i7.p1 TRINITY_DN1703_c0_g1~~TRINITY_DN1703_c0_g1_i7.p1  ORF type:complete len:260 (-),score=2.48 TRINITY_DN1703_c0_g1_i7:29-706(-)